MGLYSECKQYLIDKLKEAGVKSKPYTTQKALVKSLESHVSAVVFESEKPSRNGSKKLYRDQEGAKKKRRKIFDRPITFTVTIGDYTDDAVEATRHSSKSSSGEYGSTETLSRSRSTARIGSTKRTQYSKRKSPFRSRSHSRAAYTETPTSARSLTWRSRLSKE